MMQRLLDFLSSLKLTLVLLFGLSLISIFGTIWPSRDTDLDVFRFELFYQAPWFRLLLALLALNLTVCTLRLLARRLRERQQFFDRLKSAAGGQELSTPASADAISSSLKKLGYRVVRDGDALLGRKWWFARYSVLVIHSSLLLIMAGALLGGLGFVGTLNIHVGDTSAEIFDWDAQADRDLGFSFRLDRFEPIFYPIELRFAAIDPDADAVVQEYTVKEGETVDLPGDGWQARVDKFDPFEKALYLKVVRNGSVVQDYRAVAGVKDRTNLAAGGLVLYPLAYREPILKQYHSEVSILEEGRVVKQGVVQVNHPITHRGVTIFQTAFNRDKFGLFYGGFQFSEDPGEPLVWVGCVLLMIGFLVNLGFRPRVIGLVRSGESWRRLTMLGFRGEAGEATLQSLVEELELPGNPE